MRIVLGVTGGIAAYKAVSLARLLVEAGHDVHVIPTADALRFVGQPTWEAISRNPVTTSVHDNVSEVRHVALGQHADLVVVAPATANTLARMAAGLADDLLGTTLLATRAPVCVAPAMHTEMWEHPATQENVAILRSRGVVVIGPESGRLTGTDSGPGRMTEPEDIAREIELLLGSATPADAVAAPADAAAELADAVAEPEEAETQADRAVERERPQDLAGLRVLVTAGGTREPIDPVRYIGNRSSGRQGVALAAAAVDRGAKVVLLAANVDTAVLAEIDGRAGVRVVEVGTAAELESAALAAAEGAEVVVMAAAVSDYRVSSVASQKLRKEDHTSAPVLELVENADVLAELVRRRKPGQVIVGFAAETVTESAEGDPRAELLERGQRKLARKGCDLLAVNAVGWNRGFESAENELLILARGGRIAAEAAGTKRDVADRLIDVVREELDADRPEAS